VSPLVFHGIQQGASSNLDQLTVYSEISVLFPNSFVAQTESKVPTVSINPLNGKLNPICHLLALLGAHHIFRVSGLRVKT